jgi:pSer/pThr/pTyr-binding forkhead associated (FHA) protein
MPYVIFTANGEEYDRRELTRPLILGRAPECDVAIPDITLSRRHCRLEPSENGRAWQLVDLHSKNGTHFLGQKVECHVFRDRDELRIGRTRLTFRAGAFVPSNKVKSRGVIRPTDPHEALAGTVTGMVLCEPGETEKYEGMPMPQPRPSDPMSFQKDDVYGMINEIASSSWDSIQAQASQPTRMQRAQPVPAPTTAVSQKAVRPKPRVSFALQADHDGRPAPARAASPIAPSATLSEADSHVPPPAAPELPAPARRQRFKARPSWFRLPKLPTFPTLAKAQWNKILIALGSAAVVAVLFIGWCAFLIRTTQDDAKSVAPPSTPSTPSQSSESPAAAPETTDAAAVEKTAAGLFLTEAY